MEHRRNLKNLCRVCGVVSEKYLSKKNVERELKELLAIDCSRDELSIHPNSMCSSHYNLCMRYRRSKQAIKEYKILSKPDIKHFSPHSDNCWVCHKEDNQPTIKKRKFCNVVSISVDDVMYMSSTDRLSLLKNVLTEIPHTERSECLEHLGELAGDDITEIFDNLKDVHNDLDDLKPFSCPDTISHLRNNGIVSYINGMLKCNTNDENIKEIPHKIILIIEMIVSLVKVRFIGPVSFLASLIINSVTQSRLASDILGKLLPCGIGRTLKNWHSRQSSEPLPCPPGDLIVSFDNEQIVGRSWNIAADNKVKCSVVTNINAVSVTPEVNVQQDKSLHPKRWMKIEGNEELIFAMGTIEQDLKERRENPLKEQTIKIKETHYQEEYKYIYTFLQEVVSEQDQGTDTQTIKDHIDVEVENSFKTRNFKTCSNCDKIHPKRKRKCECGANLKQTATDTQQSTSTSINTRRYSATKQVPEDVENTDLETGVFSHIPTNHSGVKNLPKLLVPVMVNPNSFETLKEVLREIGKSTKCQRYTQTNNKRLWLNICCDGLPYTLIMKMVFDYVTCSHCGLELHGRDELNTHMEERHLLLEEKFFREFDWVLLRTGDGHFEMNLVKSLVELLWDICYKELSQKLGWRSESALASAKKCHDYHKAWQTLLVFFLGTLKELLVVYVRDRLTDAADVPSPEDFIKYAENNPNANIRFMYEIVCIYSQAILNFRGGIRRNNAALVEAGKYMARLLFHGRNHPRYQEIDILDSFISEVMPPELKEFTRNTISHSKSGDTSKGQGYDFCLEEDNREVKQWISRGVASEEQWRTVCRNKDNLSEIKNNFMDMIDIKTTSQSDRHGKLEEAVDAWRVVIRENEYFTKYGPKLTSLQGEELYAGLISFTEQAREKRTARLYEKLLHHPPDQRINTKHPVYVTELENIERNKLENQTIAELSKFIIDLIDTLPTQFKEIYIQEFKHSVEGKTKSKYLEFVTVLTDELDTHADAILAELGDLHDVYNNDN